MFSKSKVWYCWWKIKCIRSDNSTEMTGKDFQSLPTLLNGRAERHWRTLLKSQDVRYFPRNLPPKLWICDVMTTAVMLNRCYNRRAGPTSHYMLTRKMPKNFQKWGCLRYKQGIFGHGRNSPSCWVYKPETEAQTGEIVDTCQTQTDLEMCDGFHEERF